MRSGLPLLVGMVVAFAAVATLAAVAGGWAVEANQYGRVVALLLLALFGLTLLFPELADYLMRPFVALGASLSRSVERRAGAQTSTVLPSFFLGIATGLLWAPCAGPLLGLILAGAALRGVSVETSLLLFAYAAGAATSLALALLLGGRVMAAMKRSLGVGEWIKRVLGAAVLVSVAAIAMGLDTGFLAKLSTASTTSIEQALIDRFHPASGKADKPVSAEGRVGDLPVGGAFPSISGATAWLNAPSLTNAGLKGKVVLIDFWTYSCINCIRSVPYVRAWAEKYKDRGLVVIGVHAPEFAFEKNIDNVRTAVSDLKIVYPVAIDNEYAIWRAFDNKYWPAHYFIDAQGRMRHQHFGEGGYAESERVIQKLLAEAGQTSLSPEIVSVTAQGAQAASSWGEIRSLETYIGYGRAENFISPGGMARDARHVYTASVQRLNEWGLLGDWTAREEDAVLNEKSGGIVFRFHARDLHLVLGPAAAGKIVRFRVTIDGKAPGDNRGMDVDADGLGVVTGQRLYQLIRQGGAIRERTFEIRFLDPGVQAYAFTFG